MDAASPFRIVLNYRRDDTAGHAGRLYDELVERFGDQSVFMDIDAIEPGVDFAEVIQKAVGSCDAFLALIGKRWVTAADARGRRRLDSPEDYVRLEIEAALDRNVRLIPVLVQGAEMPASDELPGPLSRLARRNAHEISDSRWRYDVARLITTLETLQGEKQNARDETSSETAALDEVRRDSGREPPARTGASPDRSFEQPSRDREAAPRVAIPRRAFIVAAGVVTLAIAALVAVVLTRGGDGEPGEPPVAEGPGIPQLESGRLVYAGGGQIYTVNSDGTGKLALTSGSAPDWSPDGTKIAFARDADIYVMNVDEREETQLTSGSAIDNAPAWSSDGEELAFDRRPNESSNALQVWTMNADGADDQPLTAGAAPDWSPTGEIVLQRLGAILAVNADGSGDRRITRGVSASWSPDGTEIVFADASGIHLVNEDGSGKQPLNPGTRGNYPAWSPDGTRIAVVARDGIWIVTRDGSTPPESIVSGSGLESPSWAP